MAESFQYEKKKKLTHSEKRKNCSLQAISPFPNNVFKQFALQTRKKTGLVWERVNSIIKKFQLLMNQFPKKAQNNENF